MQNKSQRRRTWHFFHISEIIMFGKLLLTPHGGAISRNLSVVTNRPVQHHNARFRHGTQLHVQFVFRNLCILHTVISSVLFIRIRPSGLWTPTNPQSDFILLVCISHLIGKIVCFVFFLVIRVRLLLNIVCFFSSRTNPCRDWLDEGKDSFANLEMSVICFMSVFRKNFSWNICSGVI